MSIPYWRIVPIDCEQPEGSRRVLLHGQYDEVVGPMTIELAEAWIERFDQPPSLRLSKPAAAAFRRPRKGARPKSTEPSDRPSIAAEVLTGGG